MCFAHRASPDRRKLEAEAEDRVVLVVEVRHHRVGAGVVHRLVVAVDVAEVPPPVLVHDLALAVERVRPVERRPYEGEVVGVRVGRLGREVRDGAGRSDPLGRDRDPRRGAEPLQHLGRGVAAERDREHPRLLLAALELVEVGELLREQPQRDRVGRRLDRHREILPEVRRGDPQAGDQHDGRGAAGRFGTVQPVAPEPERHDTVAVDVVPALPVLPAARLLVQLERQRIVVRRGAACDGAAGWHGGGRR
jgi:hypothetical protein